MKTEHAAAIASSVGKSDLLRRMWSAFRLAAAYTALGMAAGLLLLFIIVHYFQRGMANKPDQTDLFLLEGDGLRGIVPLSPDHDKHGKVLHGYALSEKTDEGDGSEEDALEESLQYLDKTRVLLNKDKHIETAK